MSAQIRVDGTWLATIAGWGELTWSHAADGGCKEASWRMDLSKTFSHPSLWRGKLVEIKDCGANVWQGLLTEPDVDDGWTFHALGLSAKGKDFLCFDGSGNATSKPNTAVDQAIADGIGWKRTVSLSSAAFATNDATNAVNYVGDLLDAWSTSESKRWGVDADAQVYAVADPTVPMWALVPGAARFGLADDEYASDLYARYLAAGGYATAHASDADARTKFGYRAAPVDLTTMGRLTLGQATAQLNGILAKGKARQGYTNGAEVNKYQLTTIGGSPAYLPWVKGGQLVRMFGVLNEQGLPVPYLDWVIGESSLADDAETISLTPVGLVDRSFTDVLSGALGGAT